jgi:hypothetical protein
MLEHIPHDLTKRTLKEANRYAAARPTIKVNDGTPGNKIAVRVPYALSAVPPVNCLIGISCRSSAPHRRRFTRQPQADVDGRV